MAELGLAAAVWGPRTSGYPDSSNGSYYDMTEFADGTTLPSPPGVRGYFGIIMDPLSQILQTLDDPVHSTLLHAPCDMICLVSVLCWAGCDAPRRSSDTG